MFVWHGSACARSSAGETGAPKRDSRQPICPPEASLFGSSYAQVPEEIRNGVLFRGLFGYSIATVGAIYGWIDRCILSTL